VIRVQVNRETCSGFGNCVLGSKSIFDRDDEGLVVLKRPTVGDDERDAVRRAVYDCPTDSIAFTDDEDDGAGAV
jgi:ferredoxin